MHAVSVQTSFNLSHFLQVLGVKVDDSIEDFLEDSEEQRGIQKRDAPPFRRPIFDLIIGILDSLYSTVQTETRAKREKDGRRHVYQINWAVYWF